MKYETKVKWGKTFLAIGMTLGILWLGSCDVPQAKAFSGDCAINAMFKGTFLFKNYSGDTTGFGLARDECIRRGGGVITIGPGCEAKTFTWPLNAGILVLKSTINGWYAIPDSTGGGGGGNGVGGGIISRLGPASSPGVGGAIRIVEGLTFPSWTSAIADLPSTGAGVLYPDSSRLLLRNPRACIYLREAIQAGNGPTDPLLYSQKTLDLSTTINSQASKSVDIVSRFSNSTSSTNLSLNGAHFINQYGIGGVGGGDVQTGMGVGAYSEHRGNYAITGSLYGLEAATTMYNTGSVNNAFGTLSTAQVTSGSTSTITTARGIQALARVAGTGNGTIGTAVAVEGIAGMQDNAAGTITTAIGGRFGTIKDVGVTGTITNAYGLNVLAITQGTTNNYGIRVIGASGGSNLNRGISVEGGDAFFADSLSSNGSGRVSGDWNVGFANTGTTASTVRINGGNSGSTVQRLLLLRNNVTDMALQANGTAEFLQYNHNLAFGTPAGTTFAVMNGSGQLRLGDGNVATHSLETVGGATVGDTLRVAGRVDLNNSVIQRQGADIASASNITLTSGTLYNITGNTTVTGITVPTMPAGKHYIVTFIITTTVQFTDGGNLNLNGNFNGDAAGGADRLTVDCDGTNCNEIGRAIN